MKYKKINLPVFAIENFKMKQKKMEQTIKEITGKSRKVPLTKVITAVSSKPLWLEDKELKNMTKWRKFRF
jgi:hypothetical protein